MTRKPGNDNSTTKPAAPSRAARLACLMLIVCSMTACAAGCRTRLLVLPSDRTVTFLPAGRTYHATNDTYLVPPARMQEILRALNTTNRTD